MLLLVNNNKDVGRYKVTDQLHQECNSFSFTKHCNLPDGECTYFENAHFAKDTFIIKQVTKIYEKVNLLIFLYS